MSSCSHNNHPQLVKYTSLDMLHHIAESRTQCHSEGSIQSDIPNSLLAPGASSPECLQSSAFVNSQSGSSRVWLTTLNFIDNFGEINGN